MTCVFEQAISSLLKSFIRTNPFDFASIKTEYVAIWHRRVIIFYVYEGSIHKQVERNTKCIRGNNILIKFHAVKQHVPVLIVMRNHVKVCQAKSGTKSAELGIRCFARNFRANIDG